MKRGSLLNGKRVLIVDDEPDVLETLEELLSMCDIVKAAGFDEAKNLLENQYFDIAVLDIMGVDGYKLLDMANREKILAVMCTAHALTVENTKKSFEEGAVSFIPKDEMTKIATFLNDILEAKEKGKKFWWRWLDRFGAYYDKRFGPDWQKDDKDFWEKLKYYDRL